MPFCAYADIRVLNIYERDQKKKAVTDRNLPCLRQAVTSLSLRRAGFSLMEFEVNKAALRQFLPLSIVT